MTDLLNLPIGMIISYLFPHVIPNSPFNNY